MCYETANCVVFNGVFLSMGGGLAGVRREGLPQRALPDVGARGERELGHQSDCGGAAPGVHRARGLVRRR